MGRGIVAKKKGSSETSGLVGLDFTFGMPPQNLLSQTNNIMQNSMPIARIYPGIPSFREGLDLFTRIPAFNSPPSQTGPKDSGPLYYHTLLQKHGFSLSNKHNQYVEVAYLADSFPTDSFSNEYGENFLQKFTDVASEGAASLAQIAGGRSMTEAYSSFASNLAKRGGIAGGIGKGMAGAGAVVKDLFSALPGGAQSAVHTVDKLMAGGRIDFPMVWKSSGFQPSYTMTIRLYNPAPESKETTKKYIIGPIAALMLLGIPISDDGSTYSWPFIHRIFSPGIYDLDPAFISNITIVKGGDQQQIAQNQSLSVVDVRIDFGSLYSSMLASSSDVAKSRPTLRKYLAGMGETKEAWDYKGEELANSKVRKSTTVKIPQEIVEKTQAQKSNPPSRRTKAFIGVQGELEKADLLRGYIAEIERIGAIDCDENVTCIVKQINDLKRIRARIDELG